MKKILLASVIIASFAAGYYYLKVHSSSEYNFEPATKNTSPIVEVGFTDDARVRLRNGKLVSLAGADLSQLNQVLSHYPEIKIERLFTRPEEDLDRERQPGTGDLNSFYSLTLPDSIQISTLVKELLALKVVQSANQRPVYSLP